MLKWISTGFLIIVMHQFYSQKKKIDHTAYGDWNSISSEQISSKGAVVSYQIKPLKGDGKLYVRQSKSGVTKPFSRGENAQIHHDEKFIVFEIAPQFDTIRQLKIKKTPKKKWPKDSVGIYVFQTDTLLLFPKASSYSMGEDGGDWVGILHDKKYSKPKAEKKKKRCKLFKKETPEPPKNNGSLLRLIQPLSGKEIYVESVKLVDVSKNGSNWCWVQSKTYNDSIDSSFVSVFYSATNQIKEIWKGQGEASQINFDNSGMQLAFLWSSDTSEVKVHTLCYWGDKNNQTEIIVDTLTSLFSSDLSVSQYKKPYFSENGERLFFGVGEKPKKKAKDSIPDDEKAKLDIWSWTDGRTQPQQLNELKKDLKRADLYLYSITEKRFLQLTDSTINKISIPQKNNGSFALLYTQKPYYKEMTWDTWYYDYYRMDLNTGEKVKLISHHSGRGSLSPSGKYFAYYEPKWKEWSVKDIDSGSIIDSTTLITENLYEKYHDVPGLPGAAGDVSWIKGEHDILIKGQNNYWVLNLEGDEPYQLTKGAQKEIEFDYVQLNTEEEYIDLNQPLYFQFFNEKTKNEGIVKYVDRVSKILVDEPFRITKFMKADSSDVVILRQMSLKEYPEIQVTDLTFENRKKITYTNPQQEDYNWATAELFSWVSYNGDSLSGILYKPEDFDRSKSYPLMVYFYERYTRGLHYYYAPKPTASIIYPTEYASNGYIVFIPDISYEIGHPAKSAYNAIVSGTEALLQEYSFIDSTKMALQGQSWGGYQTAQLITMTNKYKCAMAGAPVSNMFSAYGGVRWGSGHNRAFQYEKGQSRIGKTIWEAPELYIENSPIFHLPNVKTPLLIMHNDGDGAVPWYQGIEMFFGMRRLNKPVWMLNYNGDEHNLMKNANRMDLSIRMREFFDHYLLEKPMPQWMKEGLPAIDNEKNKQRSN